MQKQKIKSQSINTVKQLVSQQEQDEKISTQSSIKKITEQYTEHISKKIAQQLENGIIIISNDQLAYDNKMYQSLQEVKRPKNIISESIRKEQSQKRKIIDENIKQSFLQKLKCWTKEKSILQSRRQSIQLKKKALDISTEQIKIKQQQQREMLMKQQKLNAINAKLQQIQQRKRKRQRQLQQGSIKKSSSQFYINSRVPKYIQYLNTFKEAQKQRQIQSKLMIENKRLSFQNYLQKVKQHQKAYLQKIKERSLLQLEKMKKHKSVSSIHDRPAIFITSKKNPSQIKNIEQRIKRRKKFVQKIKLIPIKINQQINKVLQIKDDKLTNNEVHHSLTQKVFSNDRIYNELGNKYLQQLREFTKKCQKKSEFLKQFRQQRETVVQKLH